MRHNIILSPHFDDAVLSLGGLLAQHGAASTVVTFFAGKPATARPTPWDLASGFLNSDKAHKARNEENDAALKLLGVPKEQIVNLKHLDQQYRTDLLGRSNDEGLPELLLEDFLSLMQSYEDRPVNVYAPGLEIHRDHSLTKQMLLSAIPCLEGADMQCFLYQDLPYAYTISREELLKEKIITGANTEIVPIPLSREEVLKKIRAIKLYESQIGPLELFGGGNLPSRIMEFSKGQAELFKTEFEYCEVLYKIL